MDPNIGRVVKIADERFDDALYDAMVLEREGDHYIVNVHGSYQRMSATDVQAQVSKQDLRALLPVFVFVGIVLLIGLWVWLQ